jgi:hypothetical protein
MGKTSAVLLAFTVAALLVLTRVDPTIAADTPVAVLPAADVVLLLPVSPSVDRITADLSQQLNEQAAMATDDRLRVALERAAADPDLLTRVATTPVEMFEGGEAAATATAVFDVELDPAEVTIVVATVELVPGYGNTAASRDHEDGHALINRTVAIRCAGSALAASVSSGRQGKALIDGIIGYISSASYPVHDAYHDLAAGATYGQHLAHAQRALAQVTACAL